MQAAPRQGSGQRPRRRHREALFAAAALAVLPAAALAGDTTQALCNRGAVSATGNPGAGDGKLYRMVRENDVAAQRRHAWQVFATVTQPATAGVPAFMTWHDVGETFGVEPATVASAGPLPRVRLETPTQALLASGMPVQRVARGLAPMAADTTATSSTAPVAFTSIVFNSPLHDFIRDGRYYLLQTLRKATRPNSIRRLLYVDPPPASAAVAKAAWWPAAADAPTALPVYDPVDDPRSSTQPYPPLAWPRVVAVDPSGALTAPQRVRLAGRVLETDTVVALDRIYHLILSDTEAAAINNDGRLDAAAQSVLGRSLRGGDLLLLTGLHVNTREFSPWVFTTFWWHDRPDDGPKAGARPAEVRGVWRNYLMDSAFNITTPCEADGSAHIAFNPYIELYAPGGSRSGCMDCHARATWSANMPATFVYDPAQRGSARNNGFSPDPYGSDDWIFAPGTVTLDSLWSLAFHGR